LYSHNALHHFKCDPLYITLRKYWPGDTDVLSDTILHKRPLYDLVSMLLGHTAMLFVHRQC